MVVVVHGKGTVLVKLHQVDGVDRLDFGSVRDQWHLAVVVLSLFWWRWIVLSEGGGDCKFCCRRKERTASARKIKKKKE